MKNKEQKLEKDCGFTLVEMAVSFVILLMLASLSVAGVLAYQDYADFKRQNSYAQTLFSATQTKLIGYSVRGQMEELKDASEEKLDLTLITAPSGECAAQTLNGLEMKEAGIFYLVGNKDSYEKYRAGEYQGKQDKESKGYQALYGIFEEFLLDKQILNACIAVEFSPDTGQVYSVLYSDKSTAFTYTGKNRDGRVNIADRQEDHRNDYMIGYYGVE